MRRLWLFALPLACLSPTEITLRITTDAKCADLQGVSIAVGAPSTLDTLQPNTVTLDCGSDGTIGTIAIVPSSAGDEVGVRVVGGFKRSVNDCVSPYGDGCIVARRALRYVPHTPLYLPVELSVSCAGVPCDPSSTCANGKCVPAQISDPSSCTDPNGCATADGGTTPLTFDPECGDMSGLGGGASWPMTAVCPTHISRTPYLGPTTAPQVLWDGPADTAAVLSVPVVTSDGTVFLGMPNGTATALDLATGTTKWTTPAGSSMYGNPAAGADGTLVAASSNGLNGFDSVTHAVRWTKNRLAADVTIGAGEIAYDAAQSVLHATDVVSGDELWQATTSADATAFFAAPAISPDGLIYLSATDGTFAAVDPTTHHVVWSATVGGEGIPLAVTGRVFVAAAQVLTAFDKQGAALWSHQGVSSSCLALAKNGTLVIAGNNQLVGVDQSNNTLWSVPTPSSVTSCPVIDGAGIVYAVTSQSDVVAVDPTSTSGPRWIKNVPGATDVVLASGGVLVLVTSTGHVVALR